MYRQLERFSAKLALHFFRQEGKPQDEARGKKSFSTGTQPGCACKAGDNHRRFERRQRDRGKEGGKLRLTHPRVQVRDAQILNLQVTTIPQSRDS